MKIRFYQTDSGQEPVKKYLQQIPIQEAAEIGNAIEELARSGPRASSVDVRHLREKLWEARVGHHRVLYTLVCDDVAILLHAYKKQTQRTPKREIAPALRRMKQVLKAASWTVGSTG
jgi:phage-related protein